MRSHILVLFLTLNAFSTYTTLDNLQLQLFARYFDVQNMSVYHIDGTITTLRTSSSYIKQKLSDGSILSIPNWPRHHENYTAIQKYDMRFITKNKVIVMYMLYVKI